MKLFKKSLTIPLNHTLSFTCLTLIIAPLFSASHEPGRKSESNVSVPSIPVANEKYAIDIKESVMTWKCSMVFADKGGHNGFISLSKGELKFENEKLVGGSVIVDMNTITDEHHGSDNNLVEHLKSPDFFDVQKFPISTFGITKVEPAEGEHVKVTGILSIKGITNEISFPAKVDVKGRTVSASGKLIIDRTLWDVRYQSAKFFFSLADEAISDFIEFEMKIVAKK